jgi:hypothetical protein
MTEVSPSMLNQFNPEPESESDGCSYLPGRELTKAGTEPAFCLAIPLKARASSAQCRSSPHPRIGCRTVERQRHSTRNASIRALDVPLES